MPEIKKVRITRTGQVDQRHFNPGGHNADPRLLKKYVDAYNRLQSVIKVSKEFGISPTAVASMFKRRGVTFVRTAVMPARKTR